MKNSSLFYATGSLRWQKSSGQVIVMKISKLLQNVILLAIAGGFQSGGHAQENLVNLYDWTPQTLNGLSPNQGVNIWSSNSVGFDVQNGAVIFSHTTPSLTGNLDTTPGASYQISFDLSFNAHTPYVDWFSVSFGDNSFGFDPFGLIFSDPNFYSGTIDFTVIATAPITAMQLAAYGDNGESFYVSDLMVTAVPEVSVNRLLGLGGGSLLLAHLCRRVIPGRKRS
ncbi:MAG TPA: hypothetical protein VNN22_02615 [Verrucomicrobiae bacterium]|nr:hypothetical protein [Verrucomicrobiae bacterium]